MNNNDRIKTFIKMNSLNQGFPRMRPHFIASKISLTICGYYDKHPKYTFVVLKALSDPLSSLRDPPFRGRDQQFGKPWFK